MRNNSKASPFSKSLGRHGYENRDLMLQIGYLSAAENFTR